MLKSYFHKEKGGVLIIVLMLITLIVGMAQLCISSGVLQIKMLNNFKNNEESKKKAEQALTHLENKLSNHIDDLTENVTWLQFVPDTLAYGDINGIDFYKISIEHKEESGAVTQLESTLCLRRPKSFAIYLKSYQNRHEYLSLYITPSKYLQQIFSWEIPLNIKISDPVYFERNFNITYVLANNNVLYGINVKGETTISVDMVKLFQGAYQISDQSETIPLLEKGNVFWEGNSHTIMLGLVPTNPAVMFAMDITDPFRVNNLPKSTLLWYKKIPPHVQVENLKVTKSIHGWIGILSYYSENGNTHILITDLVTGALLKEFIIDGKLTSNIALVNAKEQGFSDVFYVGDDQGTIWKGDLSGKHECWRLKSYRGLVQEKIVHNLLVGRHPKGLSILLFILTEDALKRQNLIAIADTQENLSIFYRLNASKTFKQQLLWQNYLLLQDGNEQLAIFDAITGNLLERINMQYDKSVTQEKVSMQVLIDKPYDKEPFVVVMTSQGISFIKAENLSNRLGRKTWKMN